MTFGFPTTFSYGSHGLGEIFVTKINSLGTDIIYSVLIGGRGSEEVGGIAIDGDGNAYITGETQLAGVSTEQEFPTTPGAYNNTSNGGFSDAFITKLNADGTATTREVTPQEFVEGIR